MRQQTIAMALPKVHTLADVGCDHGYIGAYAIVNDIADKVYFCDISSASLDKARLLCDKLQISGKADFVCQDGLKQIAVDCAVIAGMGGLEIIQILSNTQILPHTLVLQPMRNQGDVRRYVTSQGYGVVSDKMFFDGKFYDLIVCSKDCDKKQLNQEEIAFGKDNVNMYNADFVWYQEKEIKKCNQILERCEIKKVRDRLNMLLTIKNRVKGGK